MRALRRLLGKGKLLTDPEDLLLYGYDATTIRGTPLAVVMAESTDDIRKTVIFAQERGINLTPRGTGTGLSGGSVPVKGGVVISFERMNSILKVDVENNFSIVQPGVVTSTLQETAARHNLFSPPDPSSNNVSTIGGNVAENAGGLRCFKYGVTGHYVLGIEFMDAKGNLYRTGALSDNEVEPDLTPLLVGSEGSLGLFTRIALRFVSAPEKTVTLSAYFNNMMQAFSSVEEIIGSGYVPSVLEFIDGKALSASAKHVGISYPEQTEALLLIEIDGNEADVSELARNIQNLLSAAATEVNLATDESGREQLWQLRRGISPSLIRLSSGKIHEDVAVPRGSLSELVLRIKEIENQYKLEIPLYGHAGDGNLHVVMLYNEKDSISQKSAKEASKDIFRSAIELGGTITGEHGIGSAKREYLPWQHSEAVLNLARRVKRTLDPEGIFNPGKIFIDQSNH